MRSHPSGFSLLELLIALLIISVLAGMAVPAFSQVLRRSHNTALANEMIVLVQYARSESIVQRQVITLCGSGDGSHCDGNWSRHILVFADNNRDGQRNGSERLLRVAESVKQGESLAWRSLGNRPYLQLHPDGRTRYQNGNFTYCPADRNARYALHWLLNGSGRLRLAPDKNRNGVPEKSNGRDVSCG